MKRGSLVLSSGILALAIAGTAAAGGGGGQAAEEGNARAQKKCAKAVVNGRRTCLRKGDRCKRAYRDDYLRAGFACKRGKLRKATLAQLRDGQPLLLGKNGTISFRTALAAFDAQVADLPGVEPRRGEVGHLDDATSVVGVLAAGAGKLSPAQLARFQDVTLPDENAVTIPMDEPVAPEAAPAASRPARAPPPPYNCAPSASVVGEEQLARAALGDARVSLIAHGWALPRAVKLCFLNDQGGQKPTTLAFVTVDDVPPGTSPTCNMFVTRFGRSVTDGERLYIYAHELAHCAQNVIYGTQAKYRQVPLWAREGGADWLAGEIRKEHSDVDEDGALHWTDWFDKPGKGLFERSYDALGFWAMAHQAANDGWTRIRETVRAGAGGGATAAYAAALAGLPDIFYMRWGPGYQMDNALGPEWAYDGPSIPPVKPESLAVRNGTRRGLTIEARSGLARRLEVKADVMTVQAPQGLRGLMRFGGDQLKLAKGAFCALPGGCRCRTQTNLQIPRITEVGFLGFGDAHKARTVTLEGHKLKDYCDKPKPGPGSGGGSCPTGVTPARGGGGASCPAPDPNGIMIFQGAENPEIVARFTIGECTAGSGFTAISTDGAWRLEVGIQGFSGFGQDYSIPYGGPDPQVVIDGPGGPFSNTTWQPGGLPNAGSITFDPAGRRMGLGFIEFRNASETAAIGGAGGMTCVYPTD